MVNDSLADLARRRAKAQAAHDAGHPETEGRCWCVLDQEGTDALALGESRLVARKAELEAMNLPPEPAPKPLVEWMDRTNE